MSCIICFICLDSEFLMFPHAGAYDAVVSCHLTATAKRFKSTKKVFGQNMSEELLCPNTSVQPVGDSKVVQVYREIMWL